MVSLRLTQREIEEIYSRHVDTVYYVCYCFMKNKAEAEDMVQETFLKLISKGQQFESERHEKAWLIVTASNLCRDSLKKWWRRNEDIEDHGELGAPDRLENPVLEAILQLPQEYKTPVYMFYYEGYSTAEIAEYLDVPHSTVRTRLSRARARIRTLLGGEQDAR